MNRRSIIILIALLTLPIVIQSQSLSSPDGKLEAQFILHDSIPYYTLSRKGQPIILPSRLGFELLGRKNLDGGFSVSNIVRDSIDEVWTPIWGEEAHIRNHYNSMSVTLQQYGARDWQGKVIKEPSVMVITFRLYNDGLAFRYEFPSDNALTYFKVKEELTEFTLDGDHTAWWIPGDYDTQEYYFTESRLSEIAKHIDKIHRTYDNVFTPINGSSVQTALQLRTADGLYLNIHEAAAIDYPTMHLDVIPGDTESQYTLRANLTPDAQGVKGRLMAPCTSPWRTVMVCTSATEVLASRLILNLNEPCAIEDVSWIHPIKYMGIWWEPITGMSTWNYTDDFRTVRLDPNISKWKSVLNKANNTTYTDYSSASPNGRHAANNKNVHRYIDFAAEHGFDALLVEGWNIGWEDWVGNMKEMPFDFITPYPDFDIAELNRYAHSKGIRLIMHHETASSTLNYERFMDTAYNLMHKFGYNTVKTGYVGDILPFGEHHYSQPIIRHYQRVVQETANRHIMVNGHEAVRPTGLCRTWPNMIGNESAMGTEFKSRIPAGHATILPFTRLQGGPMDYTPGIFEPDMGKIVSWRSGERMNTTICNQLALYVTFYSPLQMAADLPEHYQQHLDAFQFIKDVAVDWDTSIYLYAEPGDYIITARHPKTSSLNKAADELGNLSDGKKGIVSNAAKYVYALNNDNTHKLDTTRKTDIPRSIVDLVAPCDVWYIGGITDENARDFTVKLNFLQQGKTYEATIYTDAKNANGLASSSEYNPYGYTISKKVLTNKSVLKLHMAPCGGFAISLREIIK